MTGDRPRVALGPPAALADDRLELRVEGVDPGSALRVRASTRDELGRRWRSEAKFRSDDDGVLDVADAIPVSGTYAGADPCGLLWSMALDPDAPPSPFRKWTAEHVVVDVDIDVDGTHVAHRSVRRAFMGPGVSRTEVRDHGLVGTLFSPPGDRPHEAALVLGGSSGGMLESMAGLLASHGVAALALAYFGIYGLPDSLVEIPLEYFENAIRWLRARTDVRSVSLVGISKGAEAALLLASRDAAIRAVVTYAPSAYVFMGLAEGGVTRRSSWTADGRPLPFLGVQQPDLLPSVPVSTSGMYAGSVDDAGRELLAVATIPVERIRAPMLLVSGKDDAVWPAAQFSNVIVERLSQHRDPTLHRHLAYDGAGHSLAFPYVPTTGIVTRRGPFAFTTGGTPEGNAFAQADSWPQVIDFLT